MRNVKKDCESVVKINNYSDIVNNEKVLKGQLYQQPVSVAIQANKRSFQLYRAGIYSDLDCDTIGSWCFTCWIWL